MDLPSNVIDASDYRCALTETYRWLSRCRSRREATERLEQARTFLDANRDRLLAACGEDPNLAFWVGAEHFGLGMLKGIVCDRLWRKEWTSYTAERQGVFDLLRQDTLRRRGHSMKNSEASRPAPALPGIRP